LTTVYNPTICVRVCVCPLVRNGTPPPSPTASPAIECVHTKTKGGGDTLACG
jgi:hypothetical protein